jgi:hypothetical protein
VPVLVLTGADTPEEMRDDPETVAAALPNARVVVVEGQQHLADVLAPGSSPTTSSRSCAISAEGSRYSVPVLTPAARPGTRAPPRCR